jgi:hypothetical protein
MAVGDKVYIADKPTLDKVNNAIGTSADTSSVTGNTLWARIKNIADTIGDVFSHLTTNLSATRSAKIDNLDVTLSTRATQTSVDTANTTINEISAKAGETTDKGGSATEGTVMAKLNAILTWFTNTWTSARASFLDTNVSSRESEVDAAARYDALNSAINKTSTLNTNTSTVIGTSEDTGSEAGTSIWARLKYITTTVASILAHLTTNLSAARSAKIDNLDATVSSRASSTDLSNVNTNISTLSTKIGTTTDAAGSTTAGTIFAKLNAVLSYFTSTWTNGRATKIDNIDATVSSRATQASVNALETEANALARYNALNSAISNVNTNAARGVVKSVQRGVTTGVIGGSAENFTINLSQVVASKCLVNIYGIPYYYESSAGLYVVALSNTQLQVKVYAAGCFSWEVVEFY